MSRKIDLMIVGAQKAGTTSLKYYLEEHPRISSHIETEFSFFRSDASYSRGFETELENSFGKNIPLENKLIAKSAGLYSTPKAIARLYEHNPNCILVFLVREPVARAYSSYCMERFNGWTEKSFQEIIQIAQNGDENNSVYTQFIEMGIYHKQLSEMLNYFPISNIKVFVFEEFLKDPKAACAECFSALHLDTNVEIGLEKSYNKTEKERSIKLSKMINSLRSNRNPIKRALRSILPYNWFIAISNRLISLNKSGKKFDPIEENDKRSLKEFYRKHNEKLFQLIDREPNTSWN